MRSHACMHVKGDCGNLKCKTPLENPVYRHDLSYSSNRFAIKGKTARTRVYKNHLKMVKGCRMQDLFRKQLWTVPIKDHHFEVQALREDLERANVRTRELSQSTHKCSYILFLYHNNNI